MAAVDPERRRGVHAGLVVVLLLMTALLAVGCVGTLRFEVRTDIRSPEDADIAVALEASGLIAGSARDLGDTERLRRDGWRDVEFRTGPDSFSLSARRTVAPRDLGQWLPPAAGASSPLTVAEGLFEREYRLEALVRGPPPAGESATSGSDRRLGEVLFGSAVRFRYALTAPGRLVATNADHRDGDVAVWEIGIHDFQAGRRVSLATRELLTVRAAAAAGLGLLLVVAALADLVGRRHGPARSCASCGTTSAAGAQFFAACGERIAGSAAVAARSSSPGPATALGVAGLLITALPGVIALGARDPTVDWVGAGRGGSGAVSRGPLQTPAAFLASPTALPVRPTLVPTVAPSPTAVTTAIPPPTSRPSQSTAACGAVWVATQTGGGVGIRRQPALVDTAAAHVPEGAQLEDLCDEVRADNSVWRRVRLASGEVGYVAAQYLAARPPPPPTATLSDPVDPFTQWGGLFAGTWEGHGRTLRVNPDGRGLYEWRTYRDCAKEPAPCDQGVQYGGRAELRLERGSARLAAGQVTATNAAGTLPQGPVRLVRRDDGTADLVVPGRPPTLLCGPEYAASVRAGRARIGACGA